MKTTATASGSSVEVPPCEAMRVSAPAFCDKTFGNSRWHVVCGKSPGEMTFFTLSRDEALFCDQLFRLRFSYLAPVLRRGAVYGPDAFRMEHQTPVGEASSTLIFPPGRCGAVLFMDGLPGGKILSHIHLFTLEEGEGEQVPYADRHEDGRTFFFQKKGFWIKLRFHFKTDPPRLGVDKGWHAVRIGVPDRGAYSITLAFGTDESAADAELEALEAGLDGWREQTTAWWDDYFSSCPVVELDDVMTLRTPFSDEAREVTPCEFLVRQWWMYYWCLASVVEAPWARATPLQLADRFCFNQSFTNDNVFGIELLILTNQRHLARAHLVNAMRYMIDGTGHLHWSISVHGKCSTFVEPHGVPAIGHAIGHYVRCTGDTSILDEDAGGMTLWEKLKFYYQQVLVQRDTNGDGLVEWNHIWETGEDNKNSPFFKMKGLLEWWDFYQKESGRSLEKHSFYRENICPVTSINEQVFHLWALGEMVFLAGVRQEASVLWEDQAAAIWSTVSLRHWDEESGFYYDYDVRGGRLWPAKNLSASYALYFETDAARAGRVYAHLDDPKKFRLALLPSLSADDPLFDPDSYWSGAAWPREQGFVALGLARQGRAREAFLRMVETIASEGGLEFSETVNPLCWPVESHKPVVMTMAAINQVVLLEISGLKTWGGQAETFESGLPVTLRKGSFSPPASLGSHLVKGW